jgi:polysaccharide biosynthesis/export protein
MRIIFCVALLATLFCSCGSTRPFTYMQGKFDTASLSIVPPSDPIVQKGDLLSIIVFSDNPLATGLYNQSLSGGGGGSAATGGGNAGGGTGSIAGTTSGVSSPSAPGYLVDELGNIQFQGLGLLHVEGLTKTQLKGMLDTKLKDTLLTNPYYSIRFLNYRFTMLGEIGKPGIFTIPGERLSLLEAISLAGDLTYYGRRDNVLIIRQTNGKREWGRLDLTKPEIMASPYYYLQQNDIVIVEANRKKAAASDQLTTRNITIAATIVSTLAILYSIFRK